MSRTRDVMGYKLAPVFDLFSKDEIAAAKRLAKARRISGIASAQTLASPVGDFFATPRSCYRSAPMITMIASAENELRMS